MTTSSRAPPERFTRATSWLFGALLVALSLFVALETALRKLFGVSLQGADELGGYVLAVGGALSFTVALIERAHVRIDFLYARLPPAVRAAIDALSALSLAALGLFFARYGWPVMRDTIAYGSTAPTAWATPMIWPQSIWYGALLGFTLASLWTAVRAVRWLVTGRREALERALRPRDLREELDEELADAARR